MLMNILKDNIRLLESLAIKSTISDVVAGVPGSPEQLFLLCLQRLKTDDLEGAEAALQQLAHALHVEVDTPFLEPLRSINRIKGWQHGDEGKKKLQEFLIKELGLTFEEGSCEQQPGTLGGTADGSSAAGPAGPLSEPAPPAYSITPEQYSTAAFQADLDTKQASKSAKWLITSRDPSTLLQAVVEDSLTVEAYIKLLQREAIPPAALPVDRLAKLVTEWQSYWQEHACQSGSEPDWRKSPVLSWACQHWDDLTTEQAAAVREVLPGPAFGANPDVDRQYAVARVKKALAGPAAAATAAEGSTAAATAGSHAAAGRGSTVLLPWQSGADTAATAACLERALRECDELGAAAEWIKVHTLYAQLQLQRQQQPAVAVALLNNFMGLLKRCTWSHGGPFGLGQQQQQQQHPVHVCCSACGMRPIVGPRFRSANNFDINLCSRCVGREDAAAGGPYEEVTVDDSIYMLPEVQLPSMLQGLPKGSSEVEPELKRMIQDVILDAVASSGGECPDAAGLVLPSSKWSTSVLAEAHLLSGRGDAAKWARMCEYSGGSLSSLQDATELAFAADSCSTCSVPDDVVLQLITKNAGSEGVLVKVYELNCWKLYTATQAEADLNLELAGVAPTRSITLHTPTDPLIRCRHSVPLGLSGLPGVWLVEVVAGSRRLRARISKGGLRIWQRPSVAGQVLQVMDEDWRPVQGVRVWCDGKEYTPDSSSAEDGGTSHSNEVLLPYARHAGTSALVVAAELSGQSGAPAGPGKQCVMLFDSFKRLQEQYSLGAQLFCQQEMLLPGCSVQLVLMLSLQLHGMPAPLGLLQDTRLSLTAHTSDGGSVTQVMQDLLVDESTCTALVSYTLPQHTTKLSATLTSRLLLALPGTNGEPDYQDFDIQALLPGQTCLQNSVEIEGAGQSSDIFDVHLTTISSAAQPPVAANTTAAAPPPPAGATPSSPATAAPTYALQVLGRCGEPPTEPKVLSVWLNHVSFGPQHDLRFRVQTGPGGWVDLGHLQGIRQVRAQIECGVDCCEGSASAASGAGPGGGGGVEQHAGPVRSWCIARPSWWQGGLRAQYVMAAGATLEIPVTPAAGQAVQASLLQLVSPSLAAGAAVVANISTDHLLLLGTSTAAGSSSSSSGARGAVVSSSSSSSLGCGSAVTIKVEGLAVGSYALIVPGLLLRAPSSGGYGRSWDHQRCQPSAMTVDIMVLPAATTAAAAAAGGTRPGSATGHAAGAASDSSGPTAAGGPVAAADEGQQWLYAGPDCPHISSSVPALLCASPRQQLHVSSISCSVTSGLCLQIVGSPQQLQSAQLVLAFSRFLLDDTVQAAQLVPPQLFWANGSSSAQGFGYSTALETQRQSCCFGSGDEAGLGYGCCPQACGGLARCSYSDDARLDSAVAYVLQRRQWEASGGGRRPGVLLDRPSLLVFPHSVRSAAVSTSVLREHRKMMKRAGMNASGRCFDQYPAAACCAMPAAPPQMYGAAAAAAYGAYGAAGFSTGPGLKRQVQTAKTPALGFLAQPAAMITTLQPDSDGSLQIPAAQLQQLLAEATGHAAAGVDGGQGVAAADGDVWAATGFRVAYAAVYDPRAPGQFGSAWCAVQEAPRALSCQELEGQQQQDGPSAVAGGGSCVPGEALRDMGLSRPADPDTVSALSCEVVVLQGPGDTLTLSNAEAAEAGYFGSIQQLYRLLSGLMQLAESGAVLTCAVANGSNALKPPTCPSLLGRLQLPFLLTDSPNLPQRGTSWSDHTSMQGLPCPCAPTGTKESVSALLRQWEPLILQWPVLVSAARQDLLARLASSELIFFMALKDSSTFEKVLLPLLRCKLPSELTCLEHILLLQANHRQPPIPTVQQQPPAAASQEPDALGSVSADSQYEHDKQQLLQHWYAPHRYRVLNHLERLLLAALEGQQALLRFSQDLMFELQSPAEKGGVPRTWMSSSRRPVFEYALRLAQSLEQQQRELDGAAHQADGPDGGSQPGSPTAAAGAEDSDDYVKVESNDAAGDVAGSSMSVVPRKQTLREGLFTGLAGAPPALHLPRRMAANDAADLAARSRVAAAAGSGSNAVRVPKETKEWAECGWWRCEGPQPQLIPAARFWAEYARHLATQPPGSPFVPSDPTDVAASTAAVVAALAVTDLPWEGAAASTTGSSRGTVQASSVGCSRSYQGATLTLTARSACLLLVKMLKPVAAVVPAAAASTASRASAATDSSGSSGPAAGLSVGSSVSVLVVDRLYDPRWACSTDPETGEEVLQALQPSEQEPLVTGQRYCRSIVLTSTVASERQLQLLVQLPQGAMPLDGSSGTISKDIRLSAYTSLQLQQTFYFPQPGVFQQAPVSVVTAAGRLAWLPPAPPGRLYVVEASATAGISPDVSEAVQMLEPAARWRRCIDSRNQQQVLEYLQRGDLSGARLADASRFCRDPAFFAAAVSALNSRHMYDQALWGWSVLHSHAPALKQLLLSSQLVQQLQQEYCVPVSKLLDSVFGGTDGAAGSADSWEAGELAVKHLEFWPWVNPYCRPIVHSGADANLPSVLRDNAAIANQWKAFLFSVLLDCSKGPPPTGSSSAGSGVQMGTLTVQQATTAAVFLLLQDRIDEAEEVLQAHGCQPNLLNEQPAMTPTAGPTAAPLELQRDYLAAWLALCKPLAAPGQTPAGHPAAASAWQAVAADAVKVGRAVLQKYNGHVIGPWAKRLKALASVVSQLEQQQAAAATLQPPGTADATPEEPTPAMLSIVSLEGGSLKLHVAGLHELQLAAYQIDTELLFTTQPFSSFSSSSSSAGMVGAAQHVRGVPAPAAAEASSDGGLGRVSFVQPTAKVLLKLMLAGSSPAGGAEAAAVVRSAAGAGEPHTEGTVAGGPVTIRCRPISTNTVDIHTGAGTDPSSSSSSSSSSGVYECVVNLDAVMPGMKHCAVVLEVSGGGISRSLPRFASSLTVHLLEDQGVLQAYYQQPAATAATGSTMACGMTPAAAVYVKVFARQAQGDEFFYKDGYTDLRGRFDYVTLTSTADMSRVTRYSLLVASRDHGAVMLQAAPPPR